MKKKMLLIGINQYDNVTNLGGSYAQDELADISKLDGPVREICEFRQCMRETYGYEEHGFLYDKTASVESIYRELKKLQDLPASTQLIIYFSGHGESILFDSTAYWIASDGSESKYERKGWIEYESIVGAVNKCKCRQILIVTNCCYAGRLAHKYRRISVEDSRSAYVKLSQTKAREVICSCGDSPIENGSSERLNHFSSSLISVLSSPIRECFIAEELLHAVRAKMGLNITDYKLIPQHAHLVNYGHEDGAEFVFFANEGSLSEDSGLRGDYARALDNLELELRSNPIMLAKIGAAFALLIISLLIIAVVMLAVSSS